MRPYIMYHCHTEYSLLDSCTKYQDYIDLAVKYGQRALSISEHGKPLNWTEKWAACKKAGIRYIHSVEIYLTESLEEKVRDNYHTVLMARNMNGVKELNKLIRLSCDKEHFYYTNRITFDEFLGISDDIISTSACLASPLNKLPSTHPRYMELAEKYDFLEVQAHNHPDQIAFNKRLLELSKEIGTPLIAGTDTHSSSKYKAECRAVLLDAKHKSYGDEDAFDLSYKTYDELVEMFRIQNALPESEYMRAIENTNLLYDMTEDIELDTSIKYPILYGSREEDSRRFEETVERKFQEKLDSGVIPSEQESAFREAIKEEMRVFQKLQMDGFMLSMSELISWCKEQGMAIGTARGSVGGSRVAYVTDIIDLNPETWKTVFSRFCNEDRKEIGDIDIDCVESDRPKIFQHIVGRFGSDKTARVASFGTMQSKGVIDDVGRHLAQKWNKAHKGKEKENPWSLPNIVRIKNEFDADPEKTKKKYPELFYYYDGLLDTKISQSVHPAGMVISPITLDDNYGVFDKDGELCLLLDMENIHDFTGLAKYDFLILKTVQVIRDTCRYLNQPYPKTHEIIWEDEAVWENMIKSPTALFQMESSFAFNCLKKFKPKNIFDMALVTACIRPSGTSYRDELLARKPHKNPSEMIDELLSNNLGYLCIEGNQCVTTRRGEIPIKDIKVGDEVLTRNGYKCVTKHAKTGIKEVIEISYCGQSLVATKDHKVLTDRGWTACGDIKQGDVLGYITGGAEGNDYASPEFAKIVGWLIGDGCLNRSLALTNLDRDVLTDFKDCVEKEFPTLTVSISNVKSRVNKLDLYRGYTVFRNRRHGRKELMDRLDSLGLYEKTSKDKFIPSIIKKSSKSLIKIFLGAYTDTDSAIKNRGIVVAFYKTISKKLAYDLQEIIRKAGFVARVVNTEGSYCVVVSEAKSYLKMLYNYSYKIRKVYAKDDLVETRVNRSNVICKSTARDFFKELSKKEVLRRTGISLYAKKQYASVRNVRKIAEEFGVELPDYITNETIKWVKVDGVSPRSATEVYDITVDEMHEFVCNGIVTHNCYQEDTIQFLQEICGLSGSAADNIRRAIGRKQKDRLDAAMPAILEGYCKKSPQPREVAEAEAKEFLQIIEDSASYQFGKNHAIAYCLLSYLCAYYRYYHPLEFITAFLNNAANEEDIRSGTAYANKIGIKVTMPKWGISRSQYAFDKDKNTIAKGLTSVKYMSAGVAEELYEAAQARELPHFIDVLYALEATSVNSRQLDILIKIDFFSEYGNQRELLRIAEMFYEVFNRGQAKQIRKNKVDGTPLEEIVSKYAVGVTKAGAPSKSYTLLDVPSILYETEEAILASQLSDLDDMTKVRNFAEVMGYVGYISGKEEDRRKLYVMDIYPLKRKRDGKQFGYSVITKSIGSGIESRFTVFNKVYNLEPIQQGDIIYVTSWEREGQYFTMNGYRKICGKEEESEKTNRART